MSARSHLNTLLQGDECLRIASTTAELVYAREIWVNTNRVSHHDRKHRRKRRKPNWVKHKVGDRVLLYAGLTDLRFVRRGVIVSETLLPDVVESVPIENLAGIRLHRNKGEYADKYTCHLTFRSGGETTVEELGKTLPEDAWAALETLREQIERTACTQPDPAELERRDRLSAKALQQAREALKLAWVWRLGCKLGLWMLAASAVGLGLACLAGFMLLSLAAQGQGHSIGLAGVSLMVLAVCALGASLAVFLVANTLQGLGISAATSVLNEAARIRAQPF